VTRLAYIRIWIGFVRNTAGTFGRFRWYELTGVAVVTGTRCAKLESCQPYCRK
jgi:hypothetical protein